MILPGFPAFSKSNILGPELIVNGDFSSSTGWDVGAGWSIAGGTASFSGFSDATLTQTSPITLAVGMTLRVTFTIVSNSSGTPIYGVAGGLGSGSPVNSPGTYSQDIYIGLLPSSQAIGLTTSGAIGGPVVVDDISVKIFG